MKQTSAPTRPYPWQKENNKPSVSTLPGTIPQIVVKKTIAVEKQATETLQRVPNVALRLKIGHSKDHRNNE